MVSGGITRSVSAVWPMRRNFCGTKGMLVTGGVNVSAIRERIRHECLNKEHRAGMERCSRLSGGKTMGGCAGLTSARSVIAGVG